MRAVSALGALGALLAVALVAVSCVIETPALDSVESAVEPTAIAQIEPTAIPRPPTPQPTAPPAPSPTMPPAPSPEPTPTPERAPEPDDRPQPLPTVTGDSGFEPTVVPAGLIAIPVHNTTFRLAEARPILQLGGHTLIYLDDQAGSEIDIFTPVAFDDGTLIGSYEEVTSFLQSNALLELEESESVTIAGHSTRVFEGLGPDRTRAFITDATELKNIDLGWFPPDQLKLWVVDHPDGPVIVTAEALTDSNQYSDALALAGDILSTIDFG